MEFLDAHDVIRKNPQMYMKEVSVPELRRLLTEEVVRGGGSMDYALECPSGTSGIYIGSGWSNKPDRWNSFDTFRKEINAVHNEIIIAALSKRYAVGTISIKHDISEQLGSMEFNSSNNMNYFMKLSFGSIDLFVRNHKAYTHFAETLKPGDYQFIIVEVEP